MRSPGTGSGDWSFSTISGNAKRGIGLLNNELYIGRLVWNRQRFIKDPATGKRQARLNPPEAWIIEEVPELRIIDDDLWQEVKERQGLVRHDMTATASEGGMRPERARRPS
ncbi:MAG: recombinase family protein [Cereibacter changlensis]|nr:recombinase family protein [Cereibacter changlensis]